MSSAAAGIIGWATPDSTARTVAPTAGPPPIQSMTSRSGVPMATSPTPARWVDPVTVQTIVPGDAGVPTSRNQDGSVGEDPGDVGQRLDVVGQRRRRVAGGAGHLDIGRRAVAVAELVGTVAERWRDARERRPPVHDLEERGLLAEQVLVGPGDDVDGDSVGPARGGQLGDRLPQPDDLGTRTSTSRQR